MKKHVYDTIILFGSPDSGYNIYETDALTCAKLLNVKVSNHQKAQIQKIHIIGDDEQMLTILSQKQKKVWVLKELRDYRISSITQFQKLAVPVSESTYLFSKQTFDSKYVFAVH